MKKVFLGLVMVGMSIICEAQCEYLARGTGQLQLVPYKYEGNYKGVEMGEDDEAEVYKTIFAKTQYRLVVCIDDTLPDVEFVVSDIHRNILFDNRKHGNVRVWDFKLESSQQIKVTLRIKKQDNGKSEKVLGCVAVLFGKL